MCRPLAACLLLAAPAALAQPPAPNYYPLVANHKWEYRLDVGGMKVETVCEMKAEERDKQTVYVLETRLGQTITKEELTADEKGVYRLSFNGVALSKPLLALRYPVKPGEWADKVKVGDVEVDFKMTMRPPVEVKVAAGAYRAVPVDLVATFADQKVTGTTWYAENVGVVKQVVKLGGVELQMELTRFTPGK